MKHQPLIAGERMMNILDEVSPVLSGRCEGEAISQPVCLLPKLRTSTAKSEWSRGRLLIFKGEPIGLSHLITKPSHSIINQAFDSRLRLDARPINADGFGVGKNNTPLIRAASHSPSISSHCRWYDTELENSIPCVFQAITPAWCESPHLHLTKPPSIHQSLIICISSSSSQSKFIPPRRKNTLSASLEYPSPLTHFFFSRLVSAHVRASTTGALSEENCHPWMYGSLLWMHNGHIPGFTKIKRHLQNELSEEFFQFPQGRSSPLILLFSGLTGCTDSEWAFALFLNELSKVSFCSDAKAAGFSWVTLKNTMLVTIEKIKCWWVAAGVSEPCRMNFAVADGRSVVATKYVTSSTEDAASLYFSTGTSFEPHKQPRHTPPTSSFLDDDHHPRQDEQYRMQKFDKREKIVLIASEPLTFEKTDWIEVPCQTLIVVTPKMNVLQFPILDEFMDNVYKFSSAQS
ncbi:hypothetical protein VP01_56g2 [Puccinia sorghi]|uniref:Glutamine amidotransferase type-2 domain-containing protein n=1 Tax=Puccinia sorghi TaxID=27349 RepID=A0A0L6UIN2_9BASI|nr:hypothetical protein VP01_56g2 [Puccinia sorghi]